MPNTTNVTNNTLLPRVIIPFGGHSLLFTQAAFEITYVVLGFLAIIVNGILVGSVMATKSLRKQQWLLLPTALIISDSLLSLGYAIPSIITVDESYNKHIVGGFNLPVNMYSSTACMALNMCHISFTLMDHMLVLAIAIERVGALSFPIWYYENSDRLVKVMFGVCVSVAVILSACHFISLDSGYYGTCSYYVGYNLTFMKIFFLFLSVLCVLALFAYLILVGITIKEWHKAKAQKNADPTASEKRMKQQLGVTKIVIPILFSYTFTVIPSFIFRTWGVVAPNIRDPVAAVLANLVVQLAVTLNTFINSFIYTCRNREIRDGLRQATGSVYQAVRKATTGRFTTTVGSHAGSSHPTI